VYVSITGVREMLVASLRSMAWFQDLRDFSCESLEEVSWSLRFLDFYFPVAFLLNGVFLW